MKHDRIAVLDFGGQYVHLIATKIRALGVYAEIRDPDDPVDSFHGYKGFILSGSPALSALDEDAGWTREIMDLDTPVLGFCFGHQEIAKHGGGSVDHTRREYGAALLHTVTESPLLRGLAQEETVWMSHGDTVTRLGEGFVELGYSRGGDRSASGHRFAAIAHEERRHYGLQFHPEVDDTPCGERILRNFVFDICGAREDWTVGDQVGERAAAIRKQVGQRVVLLLASGGVDSTVAAMLFKEALGTDQLKLLHIDNGLMRKNESVGVVARLTEIGLGPSLHHVDATEDFLAALQGLTEPEEKRKAIGDTFVAIFEREARRLDIAHALLGQGTIYPDTIESGGTKRADVIKTHHNRVPLIQDMMRQGRVVEPLKDLYKTEVRELGRALGLDPAHIQRHPFPGPGLGIRLAAESSVPSDFDATGIHDTMAPMLAGTGLRGLPLPVRSVGVKADLRSYEHPVLLTGEDPGWDRLTAIATGLVKAVPGINRCLYELSRRRPGQARLVPATVTRRRLDLLRDLDQIVMDALEKHQLMTTVWQCPTVLVPLSLDGRGSELVVIRPVHSERAMTARPAWIGAECAAEITAALMAFDAVAGVAIDITTKPPATIEWE
ncbi:MAG: glutamine-hydrolyzing GMP synthase [Acidobacteria bacterium]|nr:glutamine-hydrolyzing GMP synthase [Acidobacteriota bacterium]